MSYERSATDHNRWSAMRIYWVLGLSVLVLDQITKFWAVGRLTQAFVRPEGDRYGFWSQLDRFLWFQNPRPIRPGITVIENFFDFQYVQNPGSAFGFLARTDAFWRTPLFIVVGLLVMAFIVYTFRTSEPSQRFLRIGLALVLGGAIGNFVDRIRLGYVIDFIDWHYYSWHWPTFNIADAGISVGVGLFVLDMLTHKSSEDALFSPAKSPGAKV